nr:MAG TPA: hypothetical protein [Caudoviricetes sp.]
MSELEGESFRLALPCLGKTSAILESGISSTVMPLFCFENNTAHASQRCATRAVSIRYLRAVCSEVGAGRNPRPFSFSEGRYVRSI